MRRIAAAVVGLIALGAGGKPGNAEPVTPDPVDAFTLWSSANGLTLMSIACSDTEVIVCYGMDAAQATTTATMNPDGSFTVLSASTGAPAPSVAPVDLTAGVGTRENPVPIGTPAGIGDGWTLTINQVTPDATALVMAANSFNDTPPEDSVYVMINITVAYNGPDDKALDFFGISGVTSSNVELTTFDSFVVAPDAYDGLAEVFAGGSKSGNVILTVPVAEVSTLVLYTSAGFSGDDVYFAAQ